MHCFFKKRLQPKSGVVYATQTGELLPIEDMPDAVFAEKTLGDGVCVLPSGNKIKVVSPVSGVISTIADSCHAFGVTTKDGAEIMVHVGVDTVELNGRFFWTRKRAGQTVRAGDTILHTDIAAISAAGLSTHTAILIANKEKFDIVEIFTGHVLAGETPVFRYRKKSTEEAQ